MRALAREVFLRISEEHFPGASRIIAQACQAAGFKPRTLQTPERGHTILGLIAAGCGVGLLPETLACLPHAGVVFCSPKAPISAELFLAWREDLEKEPLRHLLAAIACTPGKRATSADLGPAE